MDYNYLPMYSTLLHESVRLSCLVQKTVYLVKTHVFYTLLYSLEGIFIIC